MAQKTVDRDSDSSSSSEHSPRGETPTKQFAPTPTDLDSVDPDQDALVGVRSLDDRFNEAQLVVLVSKKDEYRCAGKKQRKEIAQRTGEIFASEILSAGVKMSEAGRAALFEVCG